MTSAPTSSFDIPEAGVALRSGLTVPEVKKLRGPEGQRWKKNGAGRVMWSAAGVAELEAQLALTARANVKPEPVAGDQVRAFVVARVRTERVLHVVLEGEKYEPLRPRCLWLPQPVGLALFTPGMPILGRARAGREDLWDYEGNPAAPGKGRRFPRRRGHW